MVSKEKQIMCTMQKGRKDNDSKGDRSYYTNKQGRLRVGYKQPSAPMYELSWKKDTHGKYKT